MAPISTVTPISAVEFGTSSSVEPVRLPGSPVQQLQPPGRITTAPPPPPPSLTATISGTSSNGTVTTIDTTSFGCTTSDAVSGNVWAGNAALSSNAVDDKMRTGTPSVGDERESPAARRGVSTNVATTPVAPGCTQQRGRRRSR